MVIAINNDVFGFNRNIIQANVHFIENGQQTLSEQEFCECKHHVDKKGQRKIKGLVWAGRENIETKASGSTSPNLEQESCAQTHPNWTLED